MNDLLLHDSPFSDLVLVLTCKYKNVSYLFNYINLSINKYIKVDMNYNKHCYCCLLINNNNKKKSLLRTN